MLLPIGILLYPFGRGAVRVPARLWFRGVARLCNLRISVSGRPVDGKGTLFVGNHVSYLDIPVLGILMNGAFVAKDDVAGWPLFGFCAKVYRTVFVKRDAREALRQRTEITALLRAGTSLILFPEGTSSDGKQVLPFKTALFGVAGDAAADHLPRVQPFSIAYTRYADGRPLDRGLQALYAWYGDMTLLPHLVSVFGLKGAMVEVTFHDPVTAADFADRKGLARHCRDRVAHGVARAHKRRVYRIPREDRALVEYKA